MPTIDRLEEIRQQQRELKRQRDDLLRVLKIATDEMCAVTFHLRSRTPKSLNDAIDIARVAIAKAEGADA